MKKNTLTKTQKETIRILTDMAAKNMALEESRGGSGVNEYQRHADRVNAFLLAAADLFLMDWRDVDKMKSEIFGYMMTQYKKYCADYCTPDAAA